MMTNEELEKTLRDSMGDFADTIGKVDYLRVQPGSEGDGEPLVLFATFYTKSFWAFMLRFRRDARNRDELLFPLKDFCRGFQFRGGGWELMAKSPYFVTGYLAATRLPAADYRTRVKPGACGQPWSLPDRDIQWNPSNVFGGGAGSKVANAVTGQKSYIGFPQTVWLDDGSVELGLHSLSLDLLVAGATSLRERAAIARISQAIGSGSAGEATALECLSAAKILEPDAFFEALRSALRENGHDV